MQSTIYSLVLALSLPAVSAHAEAPPVSSWTAGTPAIHTKVRDQGDIGFCWANAFASYLESKVLIEQKKEIQISTMYLGRAHMANEYQETLHNMNEGPLVTSGRDEMDILSRYQLIKKDPITLQVTKQYLINKFKDYSTSVEGFTFLKAFKFGAVPSDVYEKPDNTNAGLLPFPGSIPPFVNKYFSPEHAYKFEEFIANRLMDEKNIERYLGETGLYEIERDFDIDNSNTPISEADTFEFEGKKYTPTSFLQNYIGFDAAKIKADKKSGNVDNDNFDEIVSSIQGELDQQRPVLLSMGILDDVKYKATYTNDGILDPSNCLDPAACMYMGAHAVLIVNSLKDAEGNVKAFIIQNSWGPQGTDDKGVKTKERAIRGFNIVTLEYLKEAIPYRGYAFRYQFL